MFPSLSFYHKNQKNVALVLKELKVLPSTRVSSIEVYSKDENLVLRDKERIQWLAGGTLENLHYRLYDEAGTEVPLTTDVASKIQVCMWIIKCLPASLYAGYINVMHCAAINSFS